MLVQCFFACDGAGPLAQLVEQGTFNPKVAGSIPSRPTIFPYAHRWHWGIVQRQDSGFWYQLSRFESWYPSHFPRTYPVAPVAPSAGLAGRPRAFHESSRIPSVHLLRIFRICPLAIWPRCGYDASLRLRAYYGEAVPKTRFTSKVSPLRLVLLKGSTRGEGNRKEDDEGD